jgi:hypothetical protein
MGHGGAQSSKRESIAMLTFKTQMSSLGSACSPGAIAGRGFPPAQAGAGSKRAGGAYHVDAKDELAIAVHGTPGDGTEVGSADLSVGHLDSHSISDRASAGICHGLDTPTTIEQRSRLTGGAQWKSGSSNRHKEKT